MNKFFNYYTSLCAGVNTPSIFSTDPFIISIKQMFLNELQQIVYYIEKLKDLNIDMSEYTDKVIEFISVIINNMDFQKENFFVIIEDLYNNKLLLEKLYISSCEKMDISPDLLNAYKQDLSSKDNILKALNEYEKNLQLSKSELNKNKKTLYEIIINLVLNACNCLIELKNYGVNSIKAKDKVLKLLNTANNYSLSEDELVSIIKDFSECNYYIMELLSETINEKFGSINRKKVLLSPKEGKAILVSGSSFLDLEKLLIAVKDLNINIYTHNEMINAFQYKKFESYSNLVGNYKESDDSLILDFASFPGPIYISRNSIFKTDIIRGQIYTDAKYPAFGIGKIDNNDFSPIIQYAISSKGFEKTFPPVYKEIGYWEDDIQKMISEITYKYSNGEINRILIVGITDAFNINNEYIKTLLKNSSEDNYIISFSYNESRKNLYYLNCCYDFHLLYKLIKILFEKLTALQSHFGIFIADCNPVILSHLLNLIFLDVKNIFIESCCTNVISPNIISMLFELFGINKFTSPLEDIDKIK